MKWEYNHALATNDLEVLNDFGQQGWELIVAFRDIDDVLYYIYKRPIPLDNNETGKMRQERAEYFGGKVG